MTLKFTFIKLLKSFLILKALILQLIFKTLSSAMVFILNHKQNQEIDYNIIQLNFLMKINCKVKG